MRKFVVIAIVIAVAGGAAAYMGVFSRGGEAAEQQQGGGQGGPGGAPAGRGGRGNQGAGGGGGGFGPGGFGGPGGGMPRVPMTVELGTAKRGDVAAHLTVVGNLIGLQTVDVAPRTGGRLLSISVQLGDPVRRGQTIAKVEDREIAEQVNQAEASMEVSKATIRQREADLNVAQLNFDRSKNLFGRQLLAKQALDDAESRYLAAVAQLDLSKAQQSQNEARLQELKFNLNNTIITSPVDGFVGRRNVDPGAMVNTNTALVSVVDISRLKLVVNVVEKDLRMVSAGDVGIVEVDAYPGEKFNGRIARVAPVLDPATRTASIEIEIPNPGARLKPGMYARVTLTIEERKNTLVAPKSAVIDFENKRGVWQPSAENRAQFVPVTLGIEGPENIEILSGLNEGDKFVTTGAAAVRNNDVLIIAGQGGPGGAGGPQKGGRGQGRGNFGGDGARKFEGQGQRPPGGQPGAGGEGQPMRKRPQ
ncbi:MAG TPA: efflux RND transporter periplasmic adaptor subunit [Vicinamibacterales bacterium]|nr:efflux RND transporter periplasmic adaptor subunit [Vicinamibacterales bacterium]